MARRGTGRRVLRLEAGSEQQECDGEEQEPKASAKQQGKKIRVRRPASVLRPSQCRGWLRRTVAEHFPEVVEGFLNEAAKGGCAHLKLAADTVASKNPGAGGGKGPAVLMLEKLERELGPE